MLNEVATAMRNVLGPLWDYNGAHCPAGKAKRKPTVAYRLLGIQPLRNAERHQSAVPAQPPPRQTREVPAEEPTGLVNQSRVHRSLYSR